MTAINIYSTQIFNSFQKQYTIETDKMKYLKQNDAKVYNCVFQLELFELRIFLKFPCKFFIEWKTVNDTQLTRTEGFFECVDGKAIFNQQLSLNVEMLQDSSKNHWIKKDSVINVYLITRNKPDFNQLAGRINIDLGAALQNNPYQKPLIQSLTYSSTSADLKFSLNIKHIFQSNKSVSQLNLSQFNDRLYLVNDNGHMSKSKSLEYLNVQHMTSSANQVGDSPHQKSETNIKLKFPKTKLSNFAHRVNDSVELQTEFATSSNEFDLRMTLGNDKKAISRQDYQEMIQFQTKGMKKSNLMVIPDIKKSRVQQEQSQFNTQRQKKPSQDDFLNNHQQQFVVQKVIRRTGSQRKCQYKRSKSPQSQVDIIVDLPDIFHSKQLNQNYLKPKQTNNLINSMNSSNNSFSISRFKAHLQDSGQQNSNNLNSLKQSFRSLDIKSNFTNKKLSNPGQNDTIQQDNENLNRIKQLQSELDNLSNLLAYNHEKYQKLDEQSKNKDKTIKKIEVENQQLTSKIDRLQQKTEYQTKINSLNCEKLKHVSSQLSIERSRIRTSEGSSSPSDIAHLKTQIKNLKQKLQHSNLQRTSFKEKLLQRDQIELQNQIKIQQLQADLVKYKQNQKNSANTTNLSSFLQINSKINSNISSLNSQLKSSQQQTITFLRNKIQQLEQQNLKIKKLSNQNHTKQKNPTEKDQRMRQNLIVIEEQFQFIMKQLLEKENLLEQKTKEVEMWKKKSHIVTFNTFATDELKQRPLEEQLKKKSHLLQDYELHILTLEEELQKVQAQNKQLTETYNKLMRESYRFEGDLKVIKEQESFRQSFRQSFGSSGEGFRQSCSSALSNKEQNIVALYKEAVQSCYDKLNINQKFDIQFSAIIQDIRRKPFTQLERSSKMINDLLKCIRSLESDLLGTKENIQKVEKTLKSKIQQMQAKLDEIEQNQLISAGGSSNVTPLIGSIIIKQQQKDQFDQYSQATKKRVGLNLNIQSKLNREVQKLKSIIYDKNKEISDLIASYQKLRLQNQTQCMLIKSKHLKIEQRSNQDVDTELVHDILDLQIRLNKEKQKKNKVMEELQLRRSLNRSQEISQYVQQVDITTIYKEIRAIITSRQNYITTEQSFNKLINKINQIDDISVKSDKNYKLIYYLQEKSRSMSKQLQVIKLNLMKMDFKQLQKHSSKTFFSDIFKPSQHVLNQILITLEQIINNYQ